MNEIFILSLASIIIIAFCKCLQYIFYIPKEPYKRRMQEKEFKQVFEVWDKK